MADQPMDSQPQPSLPQGAQDVHKPAAAAPGSHLSAQKKFPIYPCLFQHCVSTFQNAEDLDLHYKQVHRTPHDVLNLEDVVSTPGEPSQPPSSFRPNANLGYNTIGTLVHGPFVGHVDYNDITVTEHDRGLLTETPNASFHDGRMHPSSPSLSLADMFSLNNEPHSYASSDVNRNQFNVLALPPLVPIETASTIASPPISHLTRGTLSPPPLPPQPPTIGAVPPPRHVCATCGKSFSRAPDMQRHAKKHDPAARRIDCPVPGCPYKGADGFLRRDKLANHRQNRH